MRRTLFAALCAACALPAGAAGAAERVPKVAVLEVKTVGSFDPKSVAALAPLIATELARHPVKVIAGSDLKALLGLEAQKQLLGCSDNSCMAQIGGALGVDFLLVPEVGEIGGRWLLTTTLLDVARASAPGRATKQAKNAGDLVDLVPAAVAETVVPALKQPAAATTAPAGAGAAAATAPTTSPAPAAAVEKPAPAGSRPARRIAGYSLIGAGGAALVAGVIAGGLAKAERDDAASSPPTTGADLERVKTSIDRKLWAADGLFIAAAAAAGTGLVLVLTAPPAPAKVAFAPLEGGGALVFSGGF